MQSNESISKTGRQAVSNTLCLLDAIDKVGANDAVQPLQATVLCLHQDAWVTGSLHGAKWLFPSLIPNMEMRYSI